jgi:hypothetical protein
MYRGLRWVSHPPVGMRIPLLFPFISAHNLAQPVSQILVLLDYFLKIKRSLPYVPAFPERANKEIEDDIKKSTFRRKEKTERVKIHTVRLCVYKRANKKFEDDNNHQQPKRKRRLNGEFLSPPT